MASWRNLATPLDKYMNHEHSSSTLGASKMGLKSTEREWLNGSLYNQKLQSLQDEMARLKGHLSRYSHKETSPSKNMFTPTESTNRMYTTPPEENYSQQKRFQNSREKSITDYGLDHSQGKNDYIKLVGEYQSQEYGYPDNTSPNPQRFSINSKDYFEDEVPDSGHKIFEERTKLYDDDHRLSEKYNRKFSTSKSNRMSIRDRNGISEQKIENIQEVLSNCQNEIFDLKEVVIESRGHIESLQEQLNAERRESQLLKNELQRQSVKGRNDTSYYQEESPKDKRATYDNREYNNESINKKFVSLNHSERRQRQKLLSSKAIKRRTEYQTLPIPSKDLARKSSKENGRKDLLRQSEKWQNSIDFGRSVKDVNVQCDFMLEKIADMSNELNKEEIDILNSEVESLKSQKNDMLETFQNIIQLLVTVHENSSGAEHHLKDIKKDFTDFKGDLENKLNGIDVHKVSCTLNFSPTESPYRTRISKENSQPRKHTSLAKLPASSNKTNTNPDLRKSDNLSIESPPKRQSVNKNWREAWESHIKDPLANNSKITNSAKEIWNSGLKL